MLLRTHTSPVQIRAMLKQGAPLRVIAPGRVYRSDSDATHTPMFHQIEGLVIDKGIHLGHLKWTLETFLKAFFERDDIVLRLRPSYFPSPNLRWKSTWATPWSTASAWSAAAATSKRRLDGSAGLGHGQPPRDRIRRARSRSVAGLRLRHRVDRLAMLKYGMDDLRAFFDGDVLAAALRLRRARCADAFRRRGVKA
jgi:phenylalanyl-tRNA synthetase alpha chain